MSVSVLREIEACPRRWALSTADYPELWARRGYPPRPFVAGLAGSVVHLAVEVVTKALARAGCGSVQEAAATQVMKDLGGFTKIIQECIERVVGQLKDNPRAAGAIDAALRSLRARVPEMRTQVQSLLCRVTLRAGVGAATANAGASAPHERPRAPLGLGAHPELELRPPGLGWRGRADLLTLAEDACEIIDFKTGARAADHAFQLKVYALLWSRDTELNPTARPADRLTLCYSNGDVQVAAPTPPELAALERDLSNRRAAALAAIEARPPEARPSAETCRYCTVRHLCDEYWQPATQRRLAGEDHAPSPFIDLQAKVVGRHGPATWDAVIEVARDLPSGRALVLRTPPSGPDFCPGECVRILDTGCTNDPERQGGPAVATMSALSEAFIVGQPATSKACPDHDQAHEACGQRQDVPGGTAG